MLGESFNCALEFVHRLHFLGTGEKRAASNIPPAQKLPAKPKSELGGWELALVLTSILTSQDLGTFLTPPACGRCVFHPELPSSKIPSLKPGGEIEGRARKERLMLIDQKEEDKGKGGEK